MIDFNHYFRPEQHPDAPCVTSDCLARDVIGWPSAQTGLSNCAAGVRIGLVDTAINPDHLAFEARNIEIVRLVEEELPESGRQHGTAVAALLVGSASSRTPGLIPGGKLIAVDAFHRGNGKTTAPPPSISRAHWTSSLGVRFRLSISVLPARPISCSNRRS